MTEKMGVVPFWQGYDRKEVLKIARIAEDLGYESIWVPEAWGYEQFQLLAEIAGETSRIKLATGIANVFSRSAGLLAMSAATLDEISEGRVILGLGTSGKNVVENFHGRPYRKPLTHLRETIGICKALWRGERLTPEQSTLAELRHFKLAMEPLRADIPVYVASLQQKAVREVGRLADVAHLKRGLQPHSVAGEPVFCQPFGGAGAQRREDVLQPAEGHRDEDGAEDDEDDDHHVALATEVGVGAFAHRLRDPDHLRITLGVFHEATVEHDGEEECQDSADGREEPERGGREEVRCFEQVGHHLDLLPSLRLSRDCHD